MTLKYPLVTINNDYFFLISCRLSKCLLSWDFYEMYSDVKIHYYHNWSFILSTLTDTRCLSFSIMLKVTNATRNAQFNENYTLKPHIRIFVSSSSDSVVDRFLFKFYKRVQRDCFSPKSAWVCFYSRYYICAILLPFTREK